MYPRCYAQPSWGGFRSISHPPVMREITSQHHSLISECSHGRKENLGTLRVRGWPHGQRCLLPSVGDLSVVPGTHVLTEPTALS